MRPTPEIQNKGHAPIGHIGVIETRNIALILRDNPINKQSPKLHPICIIQQFLKIRVEIKIITDIFFRFRFVP